jgi:uncharacterized protein YdeI (YjbR/CyaY-like superfamily)
VCYAFWRVTEPTFFRSAAAFRSWLVKNHNLAHELLVGFYRADSGRGGLTYLEALDEALCFGWIDGLRKRYDTGSYTVRFSPRIAGSIWSMVNTRRMKELIEQGRGHAAGLGVFQQRDEKKSMLYSYEVGKCKLGPAFKKQFRANATAWQFYQAQAPWYRRTSCYWVMSAKKEETRKRRLEILIQDSAAGRRIKPLTSNPKKPA